MRRWEDIIKMDIIEIGCTVIDWIYLAQDGDNWGAFVNRVMNALVLYAVSSVNCACVYVCEVDGRL